MIRAVTVAAITVAVLSPISGQPARAADDEGVRIGAAVAKATAAVSSFRVTLSGAQGLSETIVVVLPDRVKSNISVGAVTTESVVVGETSYVRINGGQWLISKMQNAADFARQFTSTLAKQTTYTILPDRQESGVDYGAFSATIVNAAAAPMTTECSYDKVTYFMHVCTLQPPSVPFAMTLTYSAWNDPANIVELPADAPAAK